MDFRDGHIKEALKNGKIDKNFQNPTNIDDLYSYVRLELIEKLNKDLKFWKELKLLRLMGRQITCALF